MSRRIAATAVVLSREELMVRNQRAASRGFPPLKWVEFCLACMDMGLEVKVYEAATTRSKYVYVSQGDNVFKVRFSNHAPARGQQYIKDSDFYVGRSHGLVTTTADALKAVKKRFNIGANQ